jgi:hypothetical protein
MNPDRINRILEDINRLTLAELHALKNRLEEDPDWPGGTAGVREPRNPRPDPSEMGAAIELPGVLE